MGMRRSVTAAALVGLLLLVVGACGRTEETPPAAEAPAAQAPAPAAAQPAPAAQPAARPASPPGPVREAERSPYGFYTIQLSSWRSLTKAEEEARRWQGKGLEAYVLKAEVRGQGTWYRVRAGKYPGLSVAREAMRSLIGLEDPRVWVDNYITPGPLR
jgi:septal ring-binding cell division protein DamX